MDDEKVVVGGEGLVSLEELCDGGGGLGAGVVEVDGPAVGALAEHALEGEVEAVVEDEEVGGAEERAEVEEVDGDGASGDGEGAEAEFGENLLAPVEVSCVGGDDGLHGAFQ